MEAQARPRIVASPVASEARHSSAVRAAVRLLLILTLLPVLLGLTALVLYRETYGELIYPGVRVAGVDLSRQTREQARASVLAHVNELGRSSFSLRYDDGEFHTTLRALGLTVPDADLDQLVERAWRLGREAELRPWLEAQIALWQQGHQLPLALSIDRERGRTTLRRLAEELDRLAVNADLSVQRAGAVFEVHTAPAQMGRRVNVEATLSRLEQALARRIPESLDLVTDQTAPAIGDADLVEAHDTISRVVGSPLVFARDDRRSWRIEPSALFGVIQLTGLDAGQPPVAAQVREDQLRDLVLRIADQADQPAQNARLEPRDDEVVIRAGAPGRLVDREAAVREALEQATTDNRTVTLKMVDDQPWVIDDDLTEARERANARLALPLTLEFADQRWQLERRDLAGLLAFPNTQAVPRPPPTPTPAASATATPGAGQALQPPRPAPTAMPAPGGGQAAAPGTLAATAPPRPKLNVDVSIDRAKVRSYLAQWVVAWVAQDTLDAELEVRGRTVEIRPARAGIGVDLDATAAEVATRFQAEDAAARIVNVRLVPRPPKISEADLAPARDAANLLIGRPIALRSSVGEWTITTEQLVAMLRFQGTPPRLTPFLSRERLLERVEALAREAEARAAAAGARDPAGKPLRVDVPLTGAAVWAHAQSDDRLAALHWAEDE